MVWVERGLVHFVFLLQHLWLGRSMYDLTPNLGTINSY